MRTDLFFLLPLALLACNGPSDTDSGAVGDDDDTTVTGDDDDTTVTGDDDDSAPDACEVQGNVCTWMGVPQLAGFSAENLPRLYPGGQVAPPDYTTYLFWPVDITFNADGSAYYPDYNNHRIRKVETDGTVHTISGTGFLGDGPNEYGSLNNCWSGCDAMTSAWNHPTGVAVNPAAPNEVWVAAWHNSRIDIVDTTVSTMTWLAGTGARQYNSGALDTNANGNQLDDAIMDLPSSLAFGDDGSVYFSDQANHLVRRITTYGTIEIVAGQSRHAGYDGDGGDATLAHLHGHTDQKADPGSKLIIDGHTLYIADTVNGVIRTIDLDTGVIDLFAGKYESLGLGQIADGATGLTYEGDLGSVTGYSGDDGPATDAVMNTPRDMALGIDGELYIADTKNHCVRVVENGQMHRFAGQCGAEGGFGGDGGAALDATFDDVFGVETDAEGNVYIADTNNQVIRRVKH